MVAQVEKDVMAASLCFPSADTTSLLAANQAFFDKWREPVEPPGTCDVWDRMLAKVRNSRMMLVPFRAPEFDREAFLRTIATIQEGLSDDVRLDSRAAELERREEALLGDPVAELQVEDMILLYAEADYEHFEKCPVYMASVVSIDRENRLMTLHWFKRKKVTTGWGTSGWMPHMLRSNRPFLAKDFKLDACLICLFGFSLSQEFAKMAPADVRLASTRLQEHLGQDAADVEDTILEAEAVPEH